MRRNHPTTMKTTTAKTATTTKTTTKCDDDNSEDDFPFCALEKAEKAMSRAKIFKTLRGTAGVEDL